MKAVKAVDNVIKGQFVFRIGEESLKHSVVQSGKIDLCPVSIRLMGGVKLVDR